MPSTSTSYPLPRALYPKGCPLDLQKLRSRGLWLGLDKRKQEMDGRERVE